MKVFLTGGNGFVGRACISILQARGAEVIALSSQELNLLDEEAVCDFLEYARPTHLLHTAWRPVHGDVMSSTNNFLWTKASLTLLHAFHNAGGQRAAIIGSSAEYDWTYGICRTGVTPLRPASVYGAAKYALYLAAYNYARAAGLSFVWPRVFFVYGPGEHESKLSVYVLKKLLEGRPVDLSHGQQIRDYLYIRDVAEGVIAALLSDVEGEIDIASGQPCTVAQIATALARHVEREDLLRFGARPLKSHDAASVMSDTTHARTCLRWAPRISLHEGVAEMVAWGRKTFVKQLHAMLLFAPDLLVAI